jgi:hypothetical protein
VPPRARAPASDTIATIRYCAGFNACEKIDRQRPVEKIIGAAFAITDQFHTPRDRFSADEFQCSSREQTA